MADDSERYSSSVSSSSESTDETALADCAGTQPYLFEPYDSEASSGTDSVTTDSSESSEEQTFERLLRLQNTDRYIESSKSSKADIRHVLKPKRPLMFTQPVPCDRPPGGFGGGQRRLGGVVAEEDRRSRFEFGDQYQVHARKDLSCERSISAQNHQNKEGCEESCARVWRILSGGEVPAKPTGDVVDTKTIYKMSREPRGIAVIVNNKNFLSSSGMDAHPRKGTDVDRDALEKLFKSLKFEVKIYNDVTTDRIKQIAQEMASLNHSDYDAFIFSILTHGEEGLLYGTDGTISTRDLTSAFKIATTLAGKPKMFFFQACQGSRFMDGMDVPDGSDCEASSKVSVPAEADFLYAYSTVPGYYSWRNSVHGSWFIQSLTKVFEENAERMDILRMLTRVNAKVSTYKSSTHRKDWDDKCQVSSTLSMLRKELYFFPEKVTEQN